MTPLVLPRPVVNQILSHAQAGGDEEICGLVGARDDLASSVYRVGNAAANPGRRFRMDPQAQIDAMRRMREAGEQLFAIYHSHPHAPAIPSPADLAEAAYPEALYLIVSLGTQGVLELRGFRLRGQQAIPVDLEVR